jgi:adenine-specific DNA methylase
LTSFRRLIELSIPLDEISAQSAREKSIRHGHISTLHIWWARRPLAACRAAVFAALVDAPDDPAERERLEKLIATIVDWDQVKHGNSAAIEEARRIIREQWGDETPRVLDMFAGGGSIPLEALRLGCEAHALELNPVAYLTLLCTLVYPQRYAQMTNDQIPMTKAGQKALPGTEGIERRRNRLAEDVRRWGSGYWRRPGRRSDSITRTPTARWW